MITLVRDRRGSVYVEFLVAIVPFFFFVLCVLQMALVELADVTVERAASAAARSAVVVLDDDPQFYGGQPRNAAPAGGARVAAIRRSAANVLAALPRGQDADRSPLLEVTFPTGPGASSLRARFSPEDMVTVHVAFHFTCGVPLARHVICRQSAAGAPGEKYARLGAEARLPNQGARYSYAGGSR